MNSENTTVKGTVTNANERGFQLHGQEGWYNWSKYATELHPDLRAGMVVSVALDNRGYVQSVTVHGEVSGEALAPHPVERTAGPQRLYDARLRLDCLKLAWEMGANNPAEELSMGAYFDRAAKIEAWARGDYS